MAFSAARGADESFVSATATGPHATNVSAHSLAAARCISFSGMRADRMVAKEVLDRLQPLGVEAALAAIDARSHRRSEKQGQLEFALHDEGPHVCAGGRIR